MSIYLELAFLVLAYMCCWFLLAQFLSDNSIIDIAWGLGFVTISTFVCLRYPTSFGYKLLSLAIILWGIRLGGYIFVRKWGHNEEDWRYANWRKQWGKQHRIKAFTRVFLLQGFLMWIIALPLMPTGLQSSYELSAFHFLGFVIWAIGFLWESIADWQLYTFKKNPSNKGKILQKGLWAWSRHPNYFGEILVWWGVFLLALPQGYWYLSIISPLTISLVLLKYLNLC